MRPYVLTGIIAGLAAGAVVAAVLAAAGALGGGAPELSEEAVREIAAAHVAEELEKLDPALDDRIVRAYAHAAPSIVVIDAEGEDVTEEDGTVRTPAALATGIVLDSSGHIVTAAHVIEGMTKYSILTPDGGRREAERVGDDAPYTDVAVLRTSPAALIPAPFSRQLPAHGETVLAIGNSLLSERIAVTSGIVSDPSAEFARARINLEGLIQTDAALNHGNSGGALVSLDGDVIGLTTFVARETRDGRFVDGVGFALPMSTVLEIAGGITARDGNYPRPTFGVVNERLLTPTAARQLELGVSQGSFLIEMRRQGVFARARIRPGDVIREINGVAIDPDTPYLNAMMGLQAGVEAEIVIHSGGEDETHLLAPELRRPR